MYLLAISDTINLLIHKDRKNLQRTSICEVLTGEHQWRKQQVAAADGCCCRRHEQLCSSSLSFLSPFPPLISPAIACSTQRESFIKSSKTLTTREARTRNRPDPTQYLLLNHITCQRVHTHLLTLTFFFEKNTHD